LIGHTTSPGLVEEQLNKLHIYFESPMKELSYDELSRHGSYNIGRNCSYNTESCTGILPDIIAIPFCSFCTEDAGETYAEKWTTSDLDGRYYFEITVDVSSIIDAHGTNGIFTIELVLADEDLGEGWFRLNRYSLYSIW
jgi:hypothetical protein